MKRQVESRKSDGMWRMFALGLVILLSSAAPAAGQAGPESGSAEEWIELANDALLPGDSMVARVRIVTRNELGGESVEEFDWVRSSEGDTSRTLIEVEAPETAEGTAYEIVARPGEPLVRWVWLADVRRLRRVAGVQRTDPFLGTQFTYEDLGLAIPLERRQGVLRRIGDPPDQWIEIESPPYHYYSRVVTRIDPETHLPTRVRFYDRAGQLFREQRFEDVRRFGEAPFPAKITVEDRLTGASSVLTFETVDFEAEVPQKRFAESVIRRRMKADAELVPDPPAEPE